MLSSVREKYFECLKDYVTRLDEACLLSTAELGRELVTADVPPEEIGEIHEAALVRLGEELPDVTMMEIARKVSTPLLEMLMAYGLAFRERSEELRLYREHLEDLVRERTAELEAFAYSMSHDLRAPLRSMEGFAMALLEDCAHGLDETRKEYATRIVHAARRMHGLIQDLLSYSRLSHRDMGRKTVSLDLSMKQVMVQLEGEIKERNATVSVEAPLPSVLAEPSALQMALTNLLSNAVKFVSPGTQPQVRIFAEDRGKRVRIWVEDNGIGIAPEHHERIFSLFERLHGIETYPGTGIGLALVRIGIKRMGGSTGVESETGHGSRFWVELKKPEKGDENDKHRR